MKIMPRYILRISLLLVMIYLLYYLLFSGIGSRKKDSPLNPNENAPQSYEVVFRPPEKIEQSHEIKSNEILPKEKKPQEKSVKEQQKDNSIQEKVSAEIIPPENVPKEPQEVKHFKPLQDAHKVNFENEQQKNLEKVGEIPLQNIENRIKNPFDEQINIANPLKGVKLENVKDILPGNEIKESEIRDEPIPNPNVNVERTISDPLNPNANDKMNLADFDKYTDKIFVQHYQHDFERNVKILTNCKDKHFMPRIYQRGEFWVLENYVRADHGELRCTESLTYVSHGDYSFLDNLVPVLERWQGPVSMALYAPGDDFKPTIDSINYLRKCLAQSDLVRKYATFHIFFDSNVHFPDMIPTTNEVIDEIIDCSKPAPYLNVPATQLYKNVQNLLYPVNVARNVARDAALTHYLLVCDIELYPTPGIPKKFLEMISRNEPPLNSTKPKVFPLPVFEVDAAFDVPLTKTELQDLYKQHKLIVFHASFCFVCHQVPGGNEWLAAAETQDLNVFNVGKRKGKFSDWEPIFIGTNNEPYYDERLSWEGKNDKMTQSRIMCMHDYEFHILNNAYVVHRPGIKKWHEGSKRKKFVHKSNHLLGSIIYPHMKILYRDRFRCTE